MAKPKASFHWDDPLLLEQQLGDDVLERLARLHGEIVAVEHALSVPADHAGDEHLAATGGHAVGVALGARPACGKKHLRHDNPSSTEYVGRSPEGMRAREVHEVGLFVAQGAARRWSRGVLIESSPSAARAR
jgi:hypothetical protein